MTYRLADIRHETHDFWVLDTHTKGFEVYRKGCTSSTQCAIVDYSSLPDRGLTKAIAECDRRQAEFDSTIAHPAE
jgi:hypothetical protein